MAALINPICTNTCRITATYTSRRRVFIPSFALLALVILALDEGTGQSTTAPAASDAQQYLTAHFSLDSNDFRDLDRRRPVTRTLDTSDGREVTTLGVVRIKVPAAFYFEQLRDIVTLKQASDAVLQIGRFSNPARLEDASGLSLDERDLESLKRCRPRHCDVQLSAEALEQFRQLPWTSSNAHAAANRTMRHVLVELVNRYREHGDAGLMTYADTESPLSLATEFRSMVATQPSILERFPALHRHLVEPTRQPTKEIEDIVYWSKEKVGPAVVVTATHLALTPLEGGSAAKYAATSKQIYGSHYFDSSLGVTVLLDAPEDKEPGMIMAYVNRSRLDVLSGLFGGLKRSIVRSRTRAAVDDNLLEARDFVESRYRAQ